MYFVILMALLAGAAGATANAAIASEQRTRSSWLWNCAAGIVAALLVPLFLHMASSNLLTDILAEPREKQVPSEKPASTDKPVDSLKTPSPDKPFVYLGFCVVAAFSSRAFISNLSDAVLKQALNTANNAAKTADAAVKTADAAVKGAEDSKKAAAGATTAAKQAEAVAGKAKDDATGAASVANEAKNKANAVVLKVDETRDLALAANSALRFGIREMVPGESRRPSEGTTSPRDSSPNNAIHEGLDNTTSVFDSDPHKGAFGGSKAHSGRMVTARTTLIQLGWCTTVMTVTASPDAISPLVDNVKFFLHPTMGSDPVVQSGEGVAILTFTSCGAFTVGIECDGEKKVDGTAVVVRLEIDLAEEPGGDDLWKSR